MVAHLQPTFESGIRLRMRLAAEGIKVFGVPDYAGNRAVLIGVRNEEWEFFTQQQDAYYNVLSVDKLK